ncbi:MAG: hypothetical protein II998_01310 [Clostridia bacterium]|nr:hypothetical protein [Clostridia bacterium]
MKNANSNKVRILNTDVKKQQSYSKFQVPGFRSGSIIKKFFALLYYCVAASSVISMTVTYIKGDFTGMGDVMTLIAAELLVIAVFLTPVLAIGFSNHYGWHGPKLFLIIMIPVCILGTMASYVSTLFSLEYMYSVNPALKRNVSLDESSDSSADANLSSDATREQSVVDSAISELDE